MIPGGVSAVTQTLPLSGGDPRLRSDCRAMELHGSDLTAKAQIVIVRPLEWHIGYIMNALGAEGMRKVTDTSRELVDQDAEFWQPEEATSWLAAIVSSSMGRIAGIEADKPVKNPIARPRSSGCHDRTSLHPFRPSVLTLIWANNYPSRMTSTNCKYELRNGRFQLGRDATSLSWQHRSSI